MTKEDFIIIGLIIMLFLAAYGINIFKNDTSSISAATITTIKMK